MKKILMAIMIMLCIGFGITTSQANIDTEDIPGGKNLLNLRTVYTIDPSNEGYSSRHYVGVHSGSTYTFVMDYAYYDSCSYVSLGFEYEEYPSGNPGWVEYQFDEVNQRVYAEFIPNADYINIYAMPVPSGPYVMSYNVMIYEGDYVDFDGFEPYVLDGFSYQDAGTLEINYDNMLTLEDIESLIIAKDPDGNTIDKTIISNSFSSSDKMPGEYQIIFQAMSNMIARTYLLSIVVYDNTPPVIVGEDTLTYEFTNRPSIEAITALYTATDNVDGSVLVYVLNQTYESASMIGSYIIEYEAMDSSGNSSTKEVIIELVDTTPPTFNGPTDLYIYTTDIPYTDAELLATLSAIDEIDGSCEVTIASNNYNQTQLAGVYEVEFITSDALGNSVIRGVWIHVIDNRGPSFETNELIIETTPSELLSESDVLSTFTSHMATLNMKVDNVKIQYSEYDTHENETGNYYVYLSYDVDGVTQTTRVLITVNNEGLSFSPYYLLGIVPIVGLAVYIFIKKRPF